MISIIQSALQNSLSYSAYRTLVSKLIDDGKSTGNEQSADLLHYSELNEVRMNRLEKTLKMDSEVLEKLQNLKSKQTWLVISEGWCGDAAQILPIIKLMAEASENIDLKIVLRDEHEDLINQFLTNGAKSIPKLLILDENANLINHWGPRPEGAKNLIIDYKAKHGIVDEPAKIALQKWYLDDKGISTMKEIVAMLQ
ncbi:thioredoxin family protein [Flavobacterium sp. F372]|uniref:Thioredoxin family protein n=1 Tax=Flavobacterium bernardetii TaxID=2813823 RepID=A0ABR7IZJ1_9FLAO|nr:thioredoxin family protein [Flavobacterium bernardetii]MBC5835128.1 thioredoxin family protein [Flavobacterium bernardetii]NHF70756.1 thioredoxin family protein [Flavobacterium bernardetii]